MSHDALLMTVELLTLKQAIAIAQLKREIQVLLESYSPSSDYSDFECVFCKERAPDNFSSVKHTPGCVGIKLRDAFNDDNEQKDK